jgi:hypothetical protein
VRHRAPCAPSPPRPTSPPRPVDSSQTPRPRVSPRPQPGPTRRTRQRPRRQPRLDRRHVLAYREHGASAPQMALPAAPAKRRPGGPSPSGSPHIVTLSSHTNDTRTPTGPPPVVTLADASAPRRDQ